MLKIISILTLIVLSLVQLSCQTNEKNSILIVAVDGLSFNDVNCNQESNGHSGLQLLCQESVRFTHAFTPSTLSNPAMVSLLTGLYPYQHKVRHNGNPALAPEFETAAELASHQDYHTSFFSGGAPVLRKTGLAQGFEVFEDNFQPQLNVLFRPFSKTSAAFLQWLKAESNNNAFFSVLYVPDLSFTTTETATEIGETRNLSYESQLEELDTRLFNLIKQLKDSHRWDKTTFILAGLNGHPSPDNQRELTPLNLHSENTQVALLIKPAQSKKRDEAITWKVDYNVSLVDVGRTLYDILGESFADDDEDSSNFSIHSLTELLKSPEAEWAEDRQILLESDWAPWRQLGDLRTAVIANHVLYINDATPQLYNTLVDRLETNPLPLLQESLLSTTRKAQKLLQKNNMTPFTPVSSETNAKFSLSLPRWLRADQEQTLLRDLKRLSSNHTESEDLSQWTAQIALNQKDWDTLRALGAKDNHPLWKYVGEKNLNVKNAKISEPCFNLLVKKDLENTDIKSCNDGLFLDFIDWIRADSRGLSKETQRVRFIRSFRNYVLDQQIERTNIALGMIWDTSHDNRFSPSKTELALNLPEYVKIRNQVYKSLTADLEEAH